MIFFFILKFIQKKEEQLAQKKLEEWEKQKQGLSSKSKNSKDNDLSSLGLGSSNLKNKSRLRNDGTILVKFQIIFLFNILIKNTRF